MCIKSCLFENNTAEAQAGAVALTIGGMSNGNDIELLGCRFYNNACTLKRCTGGAIGIDFYFDTSFNEIRIKDTEFVGNNAMDGMGGAISLSTSVGIVTDEDGRSDALILEKCLFERNMAFYDGTALGVFSLTHTEQIGLPVNITNWYVKNAACTCTVCENALLRPDSIFISYCRPLSVILIYSD